MIKIKQATAVKGFSALGNDSRLKVFRLLVQAGADGTAIGTIHRHLGIPLSTLAHHLGMLVQAGLVVQQKQGREVICRANFDQLAALMAFLNENCCAGIAEETAQSDTAREEEKIGS